jgi:hypothetical protein
MKYLREINYLAGRASSGRQKLSSLNSAAGKTTLSGGEMAGGCYP